jgi:hypothetical protein
VVTVAVLVLVGGGADGGSALPSATSDPVRSDVERLRQESAVRDKDQIQDLTRQTRSRVDGFTPVAGGVSR